MRVWPRWPLTSKKPTLMMGTLTLVSGAVVEGNALRASVNDVCQICEYTTMYNQEIGTFVFYRNLNGLKKSLKFRLHTAYTTLL